MLEPWALRHKRWKKLAAMYLYQRRDLGRAMVLHATGTPEARNLNNLVVGASICTIPNGINLPELVPTRSKAGTKTALFLGRIYPVKGLPMLIEAWARVRPPNWRLVIAGPDESGHRRVVEDAVSRAGLNEIVSFAGPLGDEAKTSALSNADVFVLPSYSESFGMAVAEALAYGLPVITTTAAPWPMLAEKGCGWWVTPSPDGIAEGLRQATSCDTETLNMMGAAGRALIAAEFGWPQISEQFMAVYRQVTCAQPSLPAA